MPRVRSPSVRQLQSGGYFTAATIAHLKQDSDFDGIRTHPKFVEFMKELEKPTDKKAPEKK